MKNEIRCGWTDPYKTIAFILHSIFVILVIFRFGFEGGIWALFAPVPGHFIFVAINKVKPSKGNDTSTSLFTAAIQLKQIELCSLSLHSDAT